MRKRCENTSLLKKSSPLSKKNSGILYAISNKLWFSLIKCGFTTQNLNKRIANLQTSLFINCEIVSYTNELVNCKIYEYILKKILKNYRVRRDREFFDILPEEIKEIYDSFNYINSILDTEEKLNEYIKNNYPEYFISQKIKHSEISSSDNKNSLNKKKLKKRKVLFVDTSCI